ncbi:MAG: hypothetical protein NT007_13200 [Candidatus Kapabacteria bacterium]|nr:hypothetical protein [Candidatus Kapabacteria bacterium]
MRNFKFITVKLSLSIVLILALVACGKQKPIVFSEKITEEGLSNLFEKVKSDKSISREDIDNFSNGLSRIGLKRDSLFNKTVEQIIESQKEYNIEVSLSGLESSVKRSQVAVSHKFEYLKMAAIDTLGKDATVIYFKITNTSKKALTNILGSINVYYENQIIKQFPVNIVQTINVDEFAEIRTSPYEHDESNPYDRAVRRGEKARVVWQPYSIQFADGTQISLLK